MKLCCTFPALALMLSFVSSPNALGRGGETGTLDEDPFLELSLFGRNFGSSKNCLPYYLTSNHFRRLQARLNVMPWAPLPGWKSQRVLRLRDRYFTEDGMLEILPKDPESIL